MRIKYFTAEKIKVIFITAIFALFFCIPCGYADSEKTQYNPWLADYTSPELQALLKKGYDRILIPTAGIEQNGQFASLNKHQKILEYTMPKIADDLQKTLIVPILNAVPEGNITISEGHTAFIGTISMPVSVFESILLHTVLSLEKHGFKKFYFLGDSGGNQAGQQKIAEFLQKQGHHVYAISDYYANDMQNQYLIKHYGFTLEQIGTHVGIRDTSELLYVSPQSIRKDKIVNNQKSDFGKTGGNGNAMLADSNIGKELLKIKIKQAVNAIKRIEK